MQGMYDEIKGKGKTQLRQLNLLKKKIQLQERYINSINKEMKMIDDDIYLSNIEIYRLQKQVDTLKAQYARTVVYAYKNRSSFDYVNFIFSATSFNDAVRRVAYLKSYRAYREKQVTTINETQQLIAKRQQQQLGRKQQKSVALQSQTKEKNELADQKKEKDQVVSKLKSQSNDLKREIAVKKKRDRDLNNAIAAIIRREIEAAKKKESARLAAEKKERDRIAAERKKSESTEDNPVTAPVVTPTKPEATEKRPVTSYLEMNDRDIKL